MKERRVLAAPSVFARLSWSPWSFTDRGFLANESVARVTGDTRSRTQRHMRLDVRDGVVNTSTVPASLSDRSISNSSSNAIGDLKASRESCAKAVTEQSLWLEFVFIHAQMWHDDALHVVNDGMRPSRELAVTGIVSHEDLRGTRRPTESVPFRWG